MKLGMWAEKIGILDENPAGFRRGRSMSDVVQVMVRMQEDVEDRRRRVDVSERLLGEREWSEARHLYLRKALLRVNKSGLWGCWTEMIESGDGVTTQQFEGGGGLFEVSDIVNVYHQAALGKTVFRGKGCVGDVGYLW